ncbi:HTTM domain-containing protein [Chitinophagaceae bacterium MMS25-I14]
MMAIKHQMFRRGWSLFNKEKHIAPLAVLRMAFGAIMFISTIRFMLKGWVQDFYIMPKLYFPFYGFEWIKPMPGPVMYIIFTLMAVTALCIAAGFFYRTAMTVFFTCFVYTELIDKTYYLNHYYVVTIFAFLLLLVPANRYFSVDVIRKPSIKATHVPGWTINIFKWQLCVIYFCAGLSKLNYDWLFAAMPLKIWLPANASLPVIGALLTKTWVAYLFSWFGAVFDILIGFLLLYKPTRSWAYIFVVVFHVFTGWLFKIGMFPYIMLALTIIFFSENFHLKIIHYLQHIFNRKALHGTELPVYFRFTPGKRKLIYGLLTVYIFLQLALPFRFLLYPGTLLWTEDGYRFSWRVMLMEKSGIAFFYITDPATGRRGEVNNAKFLTPIQVKMMSTQPDMIIQYAHYLAGYYTAKGIKDPVVTTECYVTLNGSGSRLYIDSTVNLAAQTENFFSKKWVLSFRK